MDGIKLAAVDIDRMKNVEGFPIGTDSAIAELSSAPAYTACPNPYADRKERYQVECSSKYTFLSIEKMREDGTNIKNGKLGVPTPRQKNERQKSNTSRPTIHL